MDKKTKHPINSNKKASSSLCVAASFAALLITCSQDLIAEPWVSTGDERARHHLHVLADAGKINLPLTTWPLMWSGIKQQLDEINVESLNDEELWSYRFLNHSISEAKQSVSGKMELHAANSRPAFINFASDSREQAEISKAMSVVGDRFAFKIQGSAIYNSLDTTNARYDGSYLTATYGNWVFGAGAIDRWWGPGWQSSTIVSNSARPAPGFFLKRNTPKASTWPILKWLGPWDISFFANQLEEKRQVPNAKFLGGRLNFKPHKSFEFGLTRTAQWGGDGRPENFDTLKRLILGQDNVGEAGVTEENEPGNQLAGYDWRYNFTLFGRPIAIFQQRIGEDEKNGLPFQSIDFWGLETSFSTENTQNRIVIEHIDTGTHSVRTVGRGNSIYEHGTYLTGYRTGGRPLGASFDNDSRFLTILGFHEFSNGHHLNWTVGTGTINRDNSNRASPAGNVFGAESLDQDFLSITYKIPLTGNIHTNFGADIIKTPFSIENGLKGNEPLKDELESSIRISIEFLY